MVSNPTDIGERSKEVCALCCIRITEVDRSIHRIPTVKGSIRCTNGGGHWGKINSAVLYRFELPGLVDNIPEIVGEPVVSDPVEDYCPYGHLPFKDFTRRFSADNLGKQVSFFG